MKISGICPRCGALKYKPDLWMGEAPETYSCTCFIGETVEKKDADFSQVKTMLSVVISNQEFLISKLNKKE